MNRSLRMMIVIISTVLLYIGGSGVASAEELSFSVEAQLPDNQRDKNKTYFDLTVQPGATQELEVILKNNIEEEVTVLIQANTAITNDNGVIDYGTPDPKFDPTLTSPFSKIAKVEPEVKLAAKESKTIKIPVTIPTDPFNGIILGGLHFTQKETATDKPADAGVQIENKFAYVIGVRLSENDDPVAPDLALLEAKAGQRNYRNAVLATLQNPTPRIIGDMTVVADVYETNNREKPVYHSKQANLAMAPNSQFNYGISMDNKAFKAGKYYLKMTVEAADETWEFEKEFEIKPDEAKKLNEEAVELAEESTNYLPFIIGGIVLGLIILGLIIWLILSKRAQQAKAKQKLASKRKSGSKSSSRKKR